jgi:hypothetical protein
MNRMLSVVVLLLIVCYGILRQLICRLYTIPVSWVLSSMGISPNELLDQWNTFDTTGNYDHLLGFIIYYPTYLGLHLLFIYLLFRKQPQTSKWLMIGLVVVVGTLLATVFIAKWLEMWTMYDLSYKLFRQLFGLPFILLAIEGGRIIYNDAKRMMGIE